MVLAEIVSFKHKLCKSCGIESFECIMLEPCLLQPCFPVAGKSRLLLRGASFRSAPPQYDNDYYDYTYSYITIYIYIYIYTYIHTYIYMYSLLQPCFHVAGPRASPCCVLLLYVFLCVLVLLILILI